MRERSIQLVAPIGPQFDLTLSRPDIALLDNPPALGMGALLLLKCQLAVVLVVWPTSILTDGAATGRETEDYTPVKYKKKNVKRQDIAYRRWSRFATSITSTRKLVMMEPTTEVVVRT
jgi:hypothetical protein